MGVISLPMTVTRGQRRDCDLNLGPTRLSPARPVQQHRG